MRELKCEHGNSLLYCYICEEMEIPDICEECGNITCICAELRECWWKLEIIRDAGNDGAQVRNSMEELF